MIWLSLVICVFLEIGIVCLFNFRMSDITDKLFRAKTKNSLTEELEIMRGDIPKGFFKRESYEVEQLLKATGRANKYDNVKKLSLIGFAVGSVIALLIQNPFLVPIFGAAFAYIPVLYVRASAQAYKKNLVGELEGALSIITTSYLRTDDILKSVKENIAFINPPVKAHFEDFILESERINANTVSALNRLKLKIPNVIFHEWVNTLIRCQSDRSMKHTLTQTIQKFSVVRTVQAELETNIAEAKREAFMMMGMVVLNIPLLYVINRDWFETLVYTTAGKAALAVCALIIFFSLLRIIKLSKPIEYKGA